MRTGKNVSPTVMVVEDYDDNRELLCFIIRRLGCRVVEATNGSEAVQLAHIERPDLILMDLSLPIMDGITATREILRLEETKHTPVVALSAHCGEGDWTSRALAAGCLDCVCKPVGFEIINNLVSRYAHC